jgi:hypothetical protein
MGHRPHAVLAYGYDLTSSMFDYDSPEPAWRTEDGSWCDDAEQALLGAKGFTVDPDEYHDPDDVLEQCGVTLVRLDNDGDAQGVILAAKVHKTDWDTNEVIPHFVLPDAADEQLKWALGVLGIDPGERLPEWILAAYYS